MLHSADKIKIKHKVNLAASEIVYTSNTPNLIIEFQSTSIIIADKSAFQYNYKNYNTQLQPIPA